MGVTSLTSNQFWKRILMLFVFEPSTLLTEKKELFSGHSLNDLSAARTHLFTAIELLLFVFLFVIKSIKSISIAFPVIIVACIPIRVYILPKIFSPSELAILDADN